MPKDFHGYKCEFCGRVRVRKETIEKHEKECLSNPNGRNCYKCERCFIGDNFYIEWLMGDPYEREEKGVPVCEKMEDKPYENHALTCADFVYSESTYHHRRRID